VSILSVDLGTSNTVAVLAAHGRAPRVVEVDGAAAMPSAVFAAEDGRLVVGREAERRARLDPARFEPNAKRRIDDGQLLLGDRVVSVTEVFAAVLGKVGAETVRQLGGARPDEVRLTHPAQWGPVRRNVLLSAARQASLGADVVLVPEPVAAAAHFASFPGHSLGQDQALAVYDLGAGTFDVAVVGATTSGFTVLAEAGLPDLGGLDVDQALLSHVGTQISQHDPHGWQRLLRPESTADRRAARALREDVQAAKEALSGHPQTDLPLPEPFPDVLVTRAELEALIRPNLLRSVELLAATVRSAGVTSLAGVYLVGGSSRIPLVAQLIGEQLRLMPTNLDQPETAVALGAHHVSREGMSLRTENLPPAVAAEERTAAIAPPPRPPRPQPPRAMTGPPPGPVPARTTEPPGTEAAASPPFRQPPPFPVGGPVPKRSRKPSLAIVGAALVLLIVGLFALKVIDLLDLGETSADVVHTKPRPAVGSPCDDIVSANDLEAQLGGTVETEFQDTVRSYDDNMCSWLATDIDGRVQLNAVTWDDASPDADVFTVEGNDAYSWTRQGSCVAQVALQPHAALQIAVRPPEGKDGCDIAKALLNTAFDNLPDA